MLVRNPRYKVVFAHTNNIGTVYGKTEEILMDFKSVEMMLRFVNPLKSVVWCKNILGLNRHNSMTIQMMEKDELGNNVLKVLKIERN